MEKIEIIVSFDRNDQSVVTLADRLADAIRLWCLCNGLPGTSIIVSIPDELEKGIAQK